MIRLLSIKSLLIPFIALAVGVLLGFTLPFRRIVNACKSPDFR
jgi:hypothetical protein